MISLRDAVAALHDEAHADDKVTFEHCMRQACKDAHEALAHGCDHPQGWW